MEFAAICKGCYGPPKSTYKRGFKRDTIVCDKGCDNPRLLTLYCPFRMERLLYDFTYDPSCGYIGLKKGGFIEYYCSLICLNRLCSLEKLTRKMNDYDKIGILEQFQLEKQDLEKKKKTKELEKQEKEETESDSETEFEPVQKQIIKLTEKTDEIKTLEKKYQDEINKLTEKVKERDRTIFTLQCRNIELERNHR